MASPLPLSPTKSSIPNETQKNTSTPKTTHKTPSSASAFAIFSSFVKNVCLRKWWLIKTQTTTDPNVKGFGVAGFAFREGQGIRDFRSEAISKRHDTGTIETVDGITINLIGFIDRPRTRKNGFSSEVCNHFHFGFPYNWEEYAVQYCGEESKEDDIPSGVSTIDGTNSSHSNLNIPLPTSFDDIPVSQVFDLLTSPTENSEYCAILRIISNDILRKCVDNSSKHSGPTIYANDKSRGETLKDSGPTIRSNDKCRDETPKDNSSKHIGPTIHSNDKSKYETPKDHCKIIHNDNCISNTKSTKRRKSEKLDAQSKTGLRLGVATRSMRKRESGKILSMCGLDTFCEPDASTVAKTGAANASDAAAVDLFGDTGITETPKKSVFKKYREKDLAKLSGQQVVFGKKKSGGKMGSGECQTKVLLSGEETEIVGNLVESAVRRSKRLKNLSKCEYS